MPLCPNSQSWCAAQLTSVFDMQSRQPLKGACQSGAPTAKSLRPLTPGNEDFLRSSCSALRFFTSSSLVHGIILVGCRHTVDSMLSTYVHVLRATVPCRLRARLRAAKYPCLWTTQGGQDGKSV